MNFKVKKMLQAAMAVSLAFALTACGSAEGGAAGADSENGEIGECHFVMAELNPLDTIVGQTDKAFADKVEELSGGAMTVELHCEGEMGTEIDIIKDMVDGESDVDICRISSFMLSGFGCRKPTLLALPFTFESEEHFWKFAESDLAQEFLEEPLEYNLGLKGLFFGEEGFRHFFSDTPLKQIDDFKGLRVRVSTDTIMTQMVESMGATPLQVNLEEIPNSFVNDEIDAAEQPVVNYEANKFYEAAPYILMDGHTLGVVEVVISEDVWDSLTEAQQEIITEAAAYAKDYNKGLTASKEEASIKVLEENGVEISYVDDIEPYRQAISKIVTDQTKGMEDLYQQILDFGN